MKQIHLRTFLILNLCLAALTACKKLNYVDPDIKKPDIVNMSTQVKRIEVFEKLDTTHHTLSYRSDGTLDSLVTEVYQNGALKSKVLRTFKEDVGKLLKEEVLHLHPSSSYSSTKYEYEGAKIKREITESETRTYYYDQNGFMDYILSSKGDSIDVVQSPGLLETAVYSKRLIDDGETQLESWDVFGRSNWELKSDTIYYSTSGNGSGETKYVMYSNIKNPIAKHAWCYIG
ncbi:MAG TPA: hypothetical protein VL947_00715, partial [Cytophagales bacterium]|nr:hypothetical protein [Cytophagales bacterium]